MDKIVITGGSGLLGRALLARLAPVADLTVLSRSEKLQIPLHAQYPQVRFLLGDIRDRAVLAQAFRGQSLVIHAAALKHVPLSELQPTEYTSVNVLGSLTVIQEATMAGARVIGISTDKACAPFNVYGQTKLLMERMLCEYQQIAIRYGNVFESDGSVIPRWRQQLAATGAITVTDPTMTRFFFRVQDAVDEILWAAAHAPCGTVVIPPLRAASLSDLATAFVTAAGTGTITVTGCRPGEKRHESLLSAEEGHSAYADGDRIILTGHPQRTPIAPLLSNTAPRIPQDELRTWLA